MRWTAPAHTVLAAGVAVAASLVAVVAAAPGATAATSTTVDYACTSSLGASTISLDFESPCPDPPDVSVIGLSSRHSGRVVIRVVGAVPGEIAQKAAQEGATSMFVGGDVDLTNDHDPTDGAPNLVGGAEVSLGDQTDPTDVPFVQGAVHWMIDPGLREIRAGTASFLLGFRDAGGAPASEPVALTCTVPAPVLVDTFWLRSESEVGHHGPPKHAGPDPGLRLWAAGPRRGHRTGQGQPGCSRLGGLHPGWRHPARGPRRRRDGSYVLPGTGRPNGDEPRHQRDELPHGGVRPGRLEVLPGVRDLSRARPRHVRAHHARGARAGQGRRPSDEGPCAGRPGVRQLADWQGAGQPAQTGHQEALVQDEEHRGHRRSGTARAGFGRLPRGRYKVVVKYRGDDNHLGSRAARTFRVRR